MAAPEVKSFEQAQLEAYANMVKKIAELQGLLKEARKIIRASDHRPLAKDWDQRATAALK